MLHFVYGVVGSAKTTILLIHFQQAESRAMLVKPEIDKRSGSRVESRTGIAREVDYVWSPGSDLPIEPDIRIVFVDECQFLTVGQVDHLAEIALDRDVFCYGLRTDFRDRLFAGATRLFAIADRVEEVARRCEECLSRPATSNVLTENGSIVVSEDLPQVQLGWHFRAVCKHCRKRMIDELDAEN